ncbi:MAG: hypoxanthine phosphoribosyltransferase [Oscillospiraceae bacterium]|jgi:hypoxanthine phosphoribosyltransferase|nr:hypoxanthine phosphoribosyltransferase [Oscillospiraceae bacterium]
MHPDILSVTYSEEAIRQRVSELGETLARDYGGRSPVFIGILKGSFVFLADLIRAVRVPVEVQFLKASSYGAAAVTSGVVDIDAALPIDIAGRHVLLVEDILDTGTTLARLRALLAEKNPASLKVCAFLDKTACHDASVAADYAGFDCPVAFCVGYGLDYAERYRNLPYIGVLKPEVYGG